MRNEKSLQLHRVSVRPPDKGRLEARKSFGNVEGNMFGNAVVVVCSTGNTLGIFAKCCVWTATTRRNFDHVGRAD